MVLRLNVTPDPKKKLLQVAGGWSSRLRSTLNHQVPLERLGETKASALGEQRRDATLPLRYGCGHRPTSLPRSSALFVEFPRFELGEGHAATPLC